MQRKTFLKLTTALATGLLLNAPAHAQTTTINVAAFADFAGPYANVMPQMQGGRLAVIEWWNKEVGSKLNVQIVVKTFDTRYDVAQTASLWPGIKAEVKPALLLGLGGPDAAALQQRLPEDKIPMLMATATYGFGWKPNQWALNLRPTYAHEAAGFLEWFRATKLEDLYWDPEPIVKWERSVVYVRPQVFVVYDRTKMSSASVDNWMSWTIANGPELVSNTPAATVFNVVDRRAAYGGNLYRGRMTALLPVGRVVTPVNMFNRNKVHRMEIRPGTPATDTTWVTVFDAAGSELTAGNATALVASAGNVTAGEVEGAHLAAASGSTNAAVLFSRTGLPVAGTIEFRVPNAATYVVLNDLTPGASYEVATSLVDGQLSVRVTAGGSRTASAEGTLAFDVSPAAP